MLSNLTNIVLKVIGSARKEQMAKDVYNFESKLRDIERRLNNDGLIYKEPAIRDIKNLFGYHLTTSDYINIEQQLGYTVR